MMPEDGKSLSELMKLHFNSLGLLSMKVLLHPGLFEVETVEEGNWTCFVILKMFIQVRLPSFNWLYLSGTHYFIKSSSHFCML